MRARLRSLPSVECKTNSTQPPQPPAHQRDTTLPLQSIFDSVFWDTNFAMEGNGKVIYFIISSEPIKRFSTACDSSTMRIFWVKHIQLVPRDQRWLCQDSLKPQVRRMGRAQKHSTPKLEGSQKATVSNFLLVQMEKMRFKEGWWCPKVLSGRGQSSQGQVVAYRYPAQGSL